MIQKMIEDELIEQSEKIDARLTEELLDINNFSQSGRLIMTRVAKNMKVSKNKLLLRMESYREHMKNVLKN